MVLENIYERQDSTHPKLDIPSKQSPDESTPPSLLIISIDCLKDLSLKRIYKKISNFKLTDTEPITLVFDICFNHKPSDIEMWATPFNCLRNYIIQLSKTNTFVNIVVRGVTFQLLNLMLRDLTDITNIVITPKEDLINL